MKRITNLEDLLHVYRFVPKSKKVFRKNTKWIDGLPETGTIAGYKGYYRLISLLYDIGNITDDRITIRRIIDELDQIMSNGEVH